MDCGAGRSLAGGRVMVPDHQRTNYERTAECLDDLRAWPRVIARTPERSLERDFAMRIEKQMRRPGWVPGAKQLEFMRDLVKEFASDAVIFRGAK